jgi:hypothetical protein
MCAYYGAPGRDILNPALAEFFVNFNLSQNGKKGVQTVRFE